VVKQSCTSSAVEEVLAELKAMREIGMIVPDHADAYCRSNPAEIDEYRISMKVSEIADLVIFLSSGE
jgi:hypothetical protein